MNVSNVGTLTAMTLLPAIMVSIVAAFVVESRSMRKWLSAVACILAFIVIVFVFSGGCYYTTSVGRSRTNAFYHAFMVGLENYHSEYGEYPAPRKQSVHLQIDGHDYEVSGALMLYQALTGDGDDQIATVNGPHLPSDGKVTGDEVKRVFFKEMPGEAWRKTEAGWLLVDGYGHPFQYTKGGEDSVNVTYDLWSFGEMVPPGKVDKGVKQADDESGKWIRNW